MLFTDGPERGQVSFDRDRWLAGERARMVDDLRRNRLTPGMAADDVIELLGGGHWAGESELQYGLGTRPLWLFGVQGKVLIVWFDDRGRLTGTEVETWRD